MSRGAPPRPPLAPPVGLVAIPRLDDRLGFFGVVTTSTASSVESLATAQKNIARTLKPKTATRHGRPCSH
jgi:hypothetical protein